MKLEGKIEFDRPLDPEEMTRFIEFVSREIGCVVNYERRVSAIVASGDEKIKSASLSGAFAPGEGSIYARKGCYLLRFESEFSEEDLIVRGIKSRDQFISKGYEVLWENVREATQKYFTQ